MKRAVIIGASSGIGRALARKFSSEGYDLGLAARRLDLLQSLQKEIPGKSWIRQMDVSRIEQTVGKFQELVREMGQVDLVIYNSGVDYSQAGWSAETDLATLRVNMLGFVALAHAALEHFLARNSGHLAGISSIAGLRGNGRSPAYSASKAAMSNYLSGIRQKLLGTKICVTDIRPGYVLTDMLSDRKNPFWAATPEKAAGQIFDAIRKKKKTAYVTRRWWLAAQLMKITPDFIYDRAYLKMFGKDSKLLKTGEEPR